MHGGHECFSVCNLARWRLQAARLDALETFRTGAASLLLATDVAARGLDILGVDAVVNFDCPRTVETYLHRVGRTARAGRGGFAVTLAEDGDRTLLKAVVKQVGVQLAAREVPRAVVDTWRRRVEGLAATIDEVLQVCPLQHWPTPAHSWPTVMPASVPLPLAQVPLWRGAALHVSVCETCSCGIPEFWPGRRASAAAPAGRQ